MKKRDPFLEQLKRKQEAASTSPASTGKPLEQMSLEELEAETERLRWEETKLQYDRLAERERSRKAGTRSGEPRLVVPKKQVFSFPGRKRPHWK